MNFLKVKFHITLDLMYATNFASITLDGKITEKAWENIPWTILFDIEGDLKPKPYNDTK